MLSRNREISNLSGPEALQRGQLHDGDRVTKTLLLEPLPNNAALVAWQFVGQPLQEWPSWVQAACSLHKDADGKFELRHARRKAAPRSFISASGS